MEVSRITSCLRVEKIVFYNIHPLINQHLKMATKCLHSTPWAAVINITAQVYILAKIFYVNQV